MISLNSDNPITLSNLTDTLTGQVVNTATLSATLYDAVGTVVTTFDLPYVASSNGVYQGNIPASITSGLTDGALYVIRIVAVTTGGQQTFEEIATAGYTLA